MIQQKLFIPTTPLHSLSLTFQESFLAVSCRLQSLKTPHSGNCPPEFVFFWQPKPKEQENEDSQRTSRQMIAPK